MLSVLDETPDDDLLMLTRTCRRLRCLSASAYLRRLGILKSRNGRYTAYLHGRVRPEALSVLCSTPLAEELSLHCDIYYLIQYQQELIRLCKNYVITSFLVRFADDEPQLLKAECTPIALRSLLGSLSSRCMSLRIEEGSSSGLTRHLSSPSRPKRAKLFRNEIIKLASTLQFLSLPTDFFRLNSLSTICHLFSQSCSIVGFVLAEGSGHSKQRTINDRILSCLEFPSLQQFSFCGTVVDMGSLFGFIDRHPKLAYILLCNTSTRPPPATCDPVYLNHISSFTISADYASLCLGALTLPRLVRLTIMPALANPESPCVMESIHNVSSSLAMFSSQNLPDGAALILKMPWGLNQSTLKRLETFAPLHLQICQFQELVFDTICIDPILLVSQFS